MNQHPRTIAVGFDGSVPAEAAVRWALALATETGADVVIVHAVGLLEHLGGHDAPVGFEATVVRIAGEVGFDLAHLRWLVDNGDPCSVLLRVAQAPLDVDLVVVGSRGQSAHAGLLLGSTSLQLVERSRVPVVVVPVGRSDVE